MVLGSNSSLHRVVMLLLTFVLAALVFTILVMSAVPPTSRDALSHHLAVPKLWIAYGGMVELPDLLFSYYPMNLDLLYVVSLFFGIDILPKYIHFLFALATAWLIYSFLKDRLNRIYGLLAALLFLSTPVIVKLSINVYVDLGLVFFTWASIVHLCKWGRAPHRPKHLILSGIYCGLGIGTKYNGMIVLLLLTFFIPILYSRSCQERPAKTMHIFGFPLLFIITALVLFSPWMIRNYNWTGNPVYPLYHDRINADYKSLEATNMSMKPWLQRKLIYRESALETGLIPLRIFFQGEDDNPRYFDGKLNPALLLFPLFLMFRCNRMDASIKNEQWLLATFSILFLLYASFMVDMRIRYIAPIIPPLVVLCVFGIRDMFTWVGKSETGWIRMFVPWGVGVFILFFLSLNAVYVMELFQKTDSMPFIKGNTSRNEYLKSKLEDYQAIQFINRIKDDQMKVFALFLGNRLYYFDKNVVFGLEKFRRMVSEGNTEDTITSQFKKQGYTHLIVGIKPFESWANSTFNVRQLKLISRWIHNDCVKLYAENGYAVYEMIYTDQPPTSAQ